VLGNLRNVHVDIESGYTGVGVHRCYKTGGSEWSEWGLGIRGISPPHLPADCDQRRQNLGVFVLF